MSLATRVAVMEGGAIAQVGTPREVFHHPRSEFVARFVGIRNFYQGRLEPPAAGMGGLSRFVTHGHAFAVLTDAAPGPGSLFFRSEDVSISLTHPNSSARNCFMGSVVDIVPARLGVEILVDVGVEVAVLVTEESRRDLQLDFGRKVWISFKATAPRFVEDLS